MMRACTKCGETKAKSEFSTRSGRGGALNSRCKKCVAFVTREWRANNLDKVKDIRRRHHVKYMQESRERSKNWRRNNPEKYKEGWLRSNLKANYGITLEYYNSLVLSQDGKCAICGRDSNGTRWRFYVDHDHATGQVRGLLCHSCNFGLGNFRDSAETIEAALAYIRFHKSAAEVLKGVA